MKKIKLCNQLLFTILASVVLISCTPSKSKQCNCNESSCACEEYETDIAHLKTPTFVSFKNNIILCSYVDNANGYVFEIQGDEYKTAHNYLDISFIGLSSGEYNIRIRATNDSVFFIDSSFCEYFTITI